MAKSDNIINQGLLEAFHDQLRKGLAEGDVDVLANNLTSWEDRDDLTTEDSWTGAVRTVAGDTSISSGSGTKLISIEPLEDFAATAFVTTGFNLLHRATAIGTGYYFLVPKMEFGTYGTADKVNGLLFTDDSGANLTPTVYFKALSDGVPTSISDGAVCSYKDSNGYRFYTTTQPGYIIVSGITLASTCAHLGWSRRYDEFVSPTSSSDAGATLALSTILAKFAGGTMRVLTDGDRTVKDAVTFGASTSKATTTQCVGTATVAAASWTVAENEDGETYTHSATVSGMASYGLARLADGTYLSVDDHIVSFESDSDTASDQTIYYELATTVTSTVSSVTSALAIEDWGLEMLTGATGSATITQRYAQGYPDALAYLAQLGIRKETITGLQEQIAALQEVTASLSAKAEGYVRVSGSSNPALNYAHYNYDDQGVFADNSAFGIFYPCLVGTALSESDTANIGKIKYVLQKLDWTKDVDGNTRAIDGSEGDVLIVNTRPYYELAGRYSVGTVTYDVFLRSLSPFTWQGYEAEYREKFGWSPDYCVAHADTDEVTRMHSVYNPGWEGYRQDPIGLQGRYVVTKNEEGEIVETYDEDATILGDAGGLCTVMIDLPTGEQYAMNNNADTAATTPWMNQTARGAELLWSLLLAEGGTFDAHKESLMGSGFSRSSGDATSATYWTESNRNARNGMRYVDKDGSTKYRTFQQYTTGSKDAFMLSGIDSVVRMVNNWSSHFRCMEAARAAQYAIANGIGELEWFAFEGYKYKWRSVDGFAGPAAGELTCVVWKMLSAQFSSDAKSPADGTTSLEGNRADFLVTTALFHGIDMNVSPSYWTSGLLFTENNAGTYEAYMQRDQSKLVKSPTSENVATSTVLSFETAYDHVGTYTYSDGYRKNYNNKAFMLPNTDANKTGVTLHTYVCGYNYFKGGKASSGKKSVRGFRRGAVAGSTGLSPLCVYASASPSNAGSYYAFGTCCQIVDES